MKVVILLPLKRKLRNQLIEAAVSLGTESGTASPCIRTILKNGVRSGECREKLNLSYAEIFWYEILNPYGSSLLLPLASQKEEVVVIPTVDLYLYGIVQEME